MDRRKLIELLKEIEKGEDFIVTQEKELIIVFNGGHGANVYSLDDGHEVHCFSFGDFEKNRETKEKFREAAKNFIDNLE